MAFGDGKTRTVYGNDPFEEYAQIASSQKKDKEDKVVKDSEDVEQDEEEAKHAPSGPGFGFLGNEDDQKALVEDFIK